MTLIHKRLRALENGFYLYYVNPGSTNGKWVYLFESTDEHIYLLNCVKSERYHNGTFRVDCLLEGRKINKRTLSYDRGAVIFKLTEEEYLLETSEII